MFDAAVWVSSLYGGTRPASRGPIYRLKSRVSWLLAPGVRQGEGGGAAGVGEGFCAYLAARFAWVLPRACVSAVLGQPLGKTPGKGSEPLR